MNRTQLGIACLVTTAILSSILYLTYFSPDVEDLQISVKQEKLENGNFQYEGFVTNTGRANISEAVIYLKIFDIKFSDPALNGSYLYKEVFTVKNLKAGETRPFIFRYTLGENQLKGYPEDYNDGNPFTFTVDWSIYKWRVGVVAVK
jgi:hypothetical protein